jgi:hypothetical protein
MEDVNISKFRAQVVRSGSTPASPGFVVSEGQDPVNPSGSSIYVPYSGAISNVDFGEFGLDTGFVTLDTTPTNIPTEQGTIFWDADDETVDIVLNGYTMKIGEDLFYPVKNQTGSTIAKGVAVRFNGTVGNSGRLLIAPFIANGSVPSSRFMGVTAEEILNGEDGKVLYFGRVRGINTNSFNEGDILYASTTSAGGYQTAIPVAPNNIVQVAAVVTKSATVGTIFVRPTLGSNINKDEGVKITSVADKNLLQYQSGTSLWENKSLAQILGGTTSDYVRGDGSIALFPSVGSGTVTSVGLSSATSGVTIGSTPVTTSGTITLAIATASGSQNGLLSSTDWTTFNGKQNALTNPVTGTGTSGQVAYFTGTSAISSESNLFWDASNDRLGIKTAIPGKSIDIVTNVSQDGIRITGSSNPRLTIIDSTNNVQFDALTTDTEVVLRTDTNHPLHFSTNGTLRMNLTTNGRLLIGTPPPTESTFQLDVNGTGRFKVSADRNLALRFDTNITLSAQSDSAAPESLRVYADTFRIFTATSAAGLTERFTIANTGNVGIGTTSPQSFNGAANQLVVGTTSGNNGITIVAGTTGFSSIYFADGTTGNEAFRGYFEYGHSADYLAFGTAASERMRITSGGNVLIGTTTNGASKLRIVGLPTSSVGLSSGDVYNLAGVLMIA